MNGMDADVTPITAKKPALSRFPAMNAEPCRFLMIVRLHLSHAIRSFRSMNRHPANSMRRIVGTFLVFLALLVACVGVHAMPCHAAEADALHAALAVDMSGDEAADPDDDGVVPSLEDNSNGLDDTFDVPPEHTVTVPRLYPGKLPGHVPPPHAHVRGSELRPPIA
jgi:hypothetical protein